MKRITSIIKTKAVLVTLLALVIVLQAFKEEKIPTIYIIGDSTVRNFNNSQRGWGTFLGSFLDTNRIAVNNQAMAGRSTRTFIKEQRWTKVDSMLKPGDYVFMQFGHNEGSVPDTSRAGYRGVLRGTGEEVKELTWKDGTVEVVHTYGYYLRKFIREAKAKGAIPVVLSMIPRNQWDNDKVKRATNDFGKWAKEVAEQENVAFIDLNQITADKYDEMGPEKVKTLFQGDHTHTNEAGARINAASVISGIKMHPQLALNKFIK
ncbi:rhamnogalacturonan acetylesterase [Pedobacter sp. SYSU D00535]|uniref:rhamnogalacturonan acetylesterase n=1 Tax=Pedobacter sp. SYSU D00535 TaxID=2810308 RepID=UPI001A97A883|nr:rhamnogalacturonan acetylesterase [Pedobacter sp. SYSU D00535]